MTINGAGGIPNEHVIVAFAQTAGQPLVVSTVSGGKPVETVSLNFTKTKWEITVPKNGGRIIKKAMPLRSGIWCKTSRINNYEHAYSANAVYQLMVAVISRSESVRREQVRFCNTRAF